MRAYPRSHSAGLKRHFASYLLPAFLCFTAGMIAAPALAQDQAPVSNPNALIDQAIAKEKILIKNIKVRTPLVETYIQTTRENANPDLKPTDDEYMLSRVDFNKAFINRPYMPRAAEKHGFFKGSAGAMAGLSRALYLKSEFVYNPIGFMDMMFLDPNGFDRQHYAFSFVRQESLGSVHTLVYDVRPTISGMGRFVGQVWIEDQEGNIVRFSGTYTGPGSRDSSRYYFHFDSWRSNVQPGIWLPVAVYVAESGLKEGSLTLSVKAQTHFWGYSLNLPTREGENVSIKLDDAVDQGREDSPDVSPLAATHAWVAQAENNVIDRLVEAGLVAPLNADGYETQVLDQIVDSLESSSKLSFTDPVHCRVMLTTTIEATNVGNTILISKGLLDTLPNEESVASVVAMELAHVALGHHVNTRYAFNDRMLFPDTATFQRINMFHSEDENLTAAHRAMEILQASAYRDRLPNAALYYTQLADREKALKALNTAMLGDSLLKADGTPWLTDLARMSPPLNGSDRNAMAARSLTDWLKIDPWDDRVEMPANGHNAPGNLRGRGPLEVTPIQGTLARHDEARVDLPNPTPPNPVQ